MTNLEGKFKLLAFDVDGSDPAISSLGTCLLEDLISGKRISSTEVSQVLISRKLTATRETMEVGLFLDSSVAAIAQFELGFPVRQTATLEALLVTTSDVSLGVALALLEQLCWLLSDMAYTALRCHPTFDGLRNSDFWKIAGMTLLKPKSARQAERQRIVPTLQRTLTTRKMIG